MNDSITIIPTNVSQKCVTYDRYASTIWRVFFCRLSAVSKSKFKEIPIAGIANIAIVKTY